MKMAENSSKWVENTGKKRNCSLRAISPFPTVFSKKLYSRQVKTRACVGKGSDASTALRNKIPTQKN